MTDQRVGDKFCAYVAERDLQSDLTPKKGDEAEMPVNLRVTAKSLIDKPHFTWTNSRYASTWFSTTLGFGTHFSW